MNSKLSTFLAFVFGAAVGSAATWQYVKKKYEQLAQDEIDSVKVAFSKRESELDNEPGNTHVKNKAEQAKDKPNIAEYAAQLRERGYTNYANTSGESKKEEEKEPMTIDKPYVIAPEEFSEFDDYEKISLTYYADQILADDNDEIIDDVEDVIGFESLNSFGEYEDDSVFVRNDRLKCDYEILLDQRKYSDVVNRKPHEVDD